VSFGREGRTYLVCLVGDSFRREKACKKTIIPIIWGCKPKEKVKSDPKRIRGRPAIRRPSCASPEGREGNKSFRKGDHEKRAKKLQKGEKSGKIRGPKRQRKEDTSEEKKKTNGWQEKKVRSYWRKGETRSTSEKRKNKPKKSWSRTGGTQTGKVGEKRRGEIHR